MTAATLPLRVAAIAVVTGAAVMGIGLLSRSDVDIWAASTCLFSGALLAGWVAATLLSPSADTAARSPAAGPFRPREGSTQMRRKFEVVRVDGDGRRHVEARVDNGRFARKIAQVRREQRQPGSSEWFEVREATETTP